MNKYIRLLIGLLLSGWLLASCDQEAPRVSLTQLELSMSELTFDRSVAAQEVTVQATNESGEAVKWDYALTPQVEWITITTSGDKLTIATAENLTGEERHATVAVFSGNAMKKVAVNQKASDIFLSIDGADQGALALSALGEEKFVEVQTNQDEWSVESPKEPWIKVIPLYESGALKVVADRNPGIDPREAVVNIIGGAEKVAITVTQAGQIEYFLPYQENHDKMVYKDLIAFEEARGFKSTLIQFGDDEIGSQDALFFITSSPKLPEIRYFRHLDAPLVFEDAHVLLADVEEFREGGGYHKYLKDLGYTERYNSTPESPVLLSADGFLLASLYHETRFDKYYVRFNPQYLPKKEMPTFDQLPLYSAELERKISDNSVKYADIAAWEASLGSVDVLTQKIGRQDPQHPDEVFMAIYQTNKETEASKKEFRYYQFHLSALRPKPEEVQSVKSVTLCFNDYERVIFITPDSKYRTTPEFEALAAKEGFVFYGFKQDGVHFENHEKGLRMVVLMFKIPGVFGTDVTATIRYDKIPTEGTPSSSVASVTAVETFGNPFSPKLNR